MYARPATRIASHTAGRHLLPTACGEPFAATNGVVLATEKKLPSILVEEETLEKIAHYTGNIGEGDGDSERAAGRAARERAGPATAANSQSSYM